MEKILIIVAAGSGNRMKSELPKQFISINGSPVLMHTMRTFHRYDAQLRIILVLPEVQIDTWKQLCFNHRFNLIHEIRAGGPTRFHSVKKNLDIIPGNAIVAIHDGVRPLVSQETIDRCFKMAFKFGNAVPCVEIPETMRIIENNQSRQVDRSCYRLIQTPQVFKGSLLKEAYLQEYNVQFTDDAGVVEHSGTFIHLVEGNPENIKITYPKDLQMASVLLGQKPV
jgi:2-C-methyl-D-erythritol 4-phosphate cytidylyltransferase